MRRFRTRWIDPILGLGRLRAAPRLYSRYMTELRRYKRLSGTDAPPLDDLQPMLFDRVPTNPFDSHYLYQDVWAFQQISEARPRFHLDVGSRVIFCAMLSTITRVAYVDIRPLVVGLPNLGSIAGSLIALPLGTRSVDSLSCLHVAEHVGLGRYGDPLDPNGTRKAAAELRRVLAPGGSLYFSLPIGRPRTCFNAHRIHSVAQIRELFSGLELAGFAAVTDARRFVPNASPRSLSDAEYACGMFHFRRPQDTES